MGFSGKEVDEFCFKEEHISMQRCVKLHGSKDKDSAMKEMKNLTMKIFFWRDRMCYNNPRDKRHGSTPIDVHGIKKKYIFEDTGHCQWN